MKAAIMPTIVDFPTIVQEALAVFGNVFDTEAARRHFAEYLAGLMVAERKTVSGINREFALTTDQSCLNRWLTEVQWDVHTLNDRRLAWLQQAPQTRYSSRGGHRHRQHAGGSRGQADRRRGLVLGSCRRAPCHRP